MDSVRADAERRWRTRISWAAGLSWLALFAAAVVLGPIDRPGEAIVMAGITFLSGLLIGLDKGRARRRFLPIRGRGPRISQSYAGRDRGIYRSYDILEHPFELSEEDAETVTRRALSELPFMGQVISSNHDVDAGPETWEASWVLQTHDSAGRPILLDEGSISGMMAFGHLDKDSETFQVFGRLRRARSAFDAR